MNLNRALGILAASLLIEATMPIAATAAQGLCETGETVYFQCETSRRRVIALCSVNEKLQYRFGTPPRVQLRVPEHPDNTAFRIARYSRFQTERTEITFNNKGVEYAVFDYTEDGQRETGVQVTLANGNESLLRCRDHGVSQLNRLANVLKCDTEHAFGPACK
jgi:hypothetical protein